jgi:hypothetical protein
LATACLKLLECEDFRLVGIDQALDATLDLSASVAEVAPMRLALLTAEPAFAKPQHRILEHRRFAEQLTQVFPDQGVNASSRYLPRMARLSATSVRQHVHTTTAVIRVSPIVPDVHR